MNKKDARRLQAFQRQSLAYEKLLLRTIRQLLKSKGDEMARFALSSDWDSFHNLVNTLLPQFQKRFKYILREFGTQTLSEFK